MWLLLLLAVVIIILTVKKSIDLFALKDLSPAKQEIGINAVLFWGVMSLIIGIFAHFVGIMYAMYAIRMANDISPAIVAGGYAVSLITILFGLLILMLSSIFWFILRWKYKSISSS